MMQHQLFKPCRLSMTRRTTTFHSSDATTKSIQVVTAGSSRLIKNSASCTNRRTLVSSCSNKHYAGRLFNIRRISNNNNVPQHLKCKHNNTPPQRCKSSGSKATSKKKSSSASSSSEEAATKTVLSTPLPLLPHQSPFYHPSMKQRIEAASIIPPTARQLMMHALRSAVPMIGFGFMDNTIMIHAGHYVDCTLGVTFSLSTLAAAGIGQIFSGIGGVMFGDALDTAFRKIGGSTTMTRVQRAMRSSRVAGLTGAVVGVTLGCVLGLVNLLFVDEHKASLLKLQALEDGQEFEFEVEVDNEIHQGYTTVIVRGPDVDGVLASITASIASMGCSVVELHASPRTKNNVEQASSSSEDSSSGGGSSVTTLLDQLVQSQSQVRFEDVYLIRHRSTHQAIDNDDLDDLARTVLAAAKDPLNSHSLKAQVDELQMENIALADRVSMLEGMIEDRQIKVVPLVNPNEEDKQR